jgi:WD40 repeat protein
MGGMVLSADKKKILIADESGTARLIDINTSKVEQTFSSEHVDNIYSVAYANNTIITGGQDKRVGIYSKDVMPFISKVTFWSTV